MPIELGIFEPESKKQKEEELEQARTRERRNTLLWTLAVVALFGAISMAVRVVGW